MGEVKKYVKKPVVIEAIRFSDDSAVVLDAINEFMNAKDIIVDDSKGDVGIIIPTLEGDMRASVGDLIIKGVNGEFYPCKPDIFWKSYSHAESEVEMTLRPIFSSTERSVGVAPDADYGGAHEYTMKNSIGFSDGQAKYVDSYQKIQFVQKNLDGSMTPGIQSEQLLLLLIDRHKKLNEKFPSREGALAITKMEEALMWLEARVRERIERGVMGELKK